MQLTLEREFEQRKNRHKVETCVNVLQLLREHEYERENEGKVGIPIFLMRESIRKKVIEEVNMAIDYGQFENLYNYSWEVAKEILH